LNQHSNDHDINVNLGERSYSISIRTGVLDRLAEVASSVVSNKHVVVVTDSNVGPIYLQRVVEGLQAVSTRVDHMTVDAGEKSKCVSVCDQLWQRIDDINTDRHSVVVALGGGVVGDLAGFIAASYARGLSFLQIPTSLLAQVDSSVGGKVGINLPKSKNMVGAFWQPKQVVIDPAVLNSLDDANYIAGMAEVIKYGLIMDESLFEFLEANVEALKSRDLDVLSKIISWCCQCKADVVEEDETESTGRRAILNYGHTYGHAIESVFGYGKFLHGQAISIGMVCAARLAKKLGMVDQEFCDRQAKLFTAVGLPTDCPEDQHDAMLSAMMRDKKVVGGVLKFILPTRIGHVELVDSPGAEAILRSLVNK
jgi:3-dehydroquinate synthase